MITAEQKLLLLESIQKIQFEIEKLKINILTKQPAAIRTIADTEISDLISQLNSANYHLNHKVTLTKHL